MDYQLELLNLFYKEGFSKVIDKLEEILNNEITVTNLIILNLNNNNNINLLCNYIKTNISKYTNLLNNIFTSNIDLSNKKLILSKICNTYSMDNLKFFNESIYTILSNDLVEYDINKIDNNLIYIIFNTNIYDNDNFEDNYLIYYTTIFDTLIKSYELCFIDWMFKIINIYNYRCKTYSNTNLSDNILFNLLHCLLIHYNKLYENTTPTFNILNHINNNIDLTNTLLEDFYNCSTNMYEIYTILILKLTHITVYYSIEDYEYNNNIILKHTDIINKLENGTTLLNNFDILKNYLIKNNEQSILKYTNKSKNLLHKLNNILLNNIYTFYVSFILFHKNCVINDNNEFYSTIITNIIDFYIFYNNNECKYIYNSLQDKYNCIDFLNNIFYSNISNININIKLIDFFLHLYTNEFLFISNYSATTDIINTYNSNLLNKLILFYIDLNKYDDYYVNDVKYKIIYLFNILFNKSSYFKKHFTYFFNNNENISKFIINLNEDISIFIDTFLCYHKQNNSYIDICNKYYNYIYELFTFNIFITTNYLDNIDNAIINISINKVYSKFIELGKLLVRKNNIYNILISIIAYYLTLCNSSYLNYIKNNDTIEFDINLYNSVIDKLLQIKSSSFINKFKSMIQEINLIEIRNEKIYDDIPEDFLDPLCNSLIITPIILPSSKKIMDLDIIKKHLLYHNFDPFNRTELTLDILQEFNNQEENIKKNNLLKEQINSWKLNQL